jgi:G:T-mismatch repair DNA endonuclease (very short patch repair protein)
MDDGAIAKELWLDMITKTKYDEDQKGTKTIQSLMIRVMVIDECQGHKCTFNQASSCSYK